MLYYNKNIVIIIILLNYILKLEERNWMDVNTFKCEATGHWKWKQHRASESSGSPQNRNKGKRRIEYNSTSSRPTSFGSSIRFSILV